MTNVTKLFAELRKQGYTAKQRLGDCRSCSQANLDEGQKAVYTTDQSYGRNSVMVYYVEVEGTEIQKACEKLGIPYEWGGTNDEAFEILKEAK